MAEEIIESDLTIYKKDALNTVSFKISEILLQTLI